MSTNTVIDDVQRVPEHLTALLSMLEKWEARVSNELDAVKTGKAPPDRLAKQMGDIAKTSKPIAQELRAWVGKVKDVVDHMSLEDKLKVSLNLIQDLSMGDRIKFYHHIIGTEASRSDGGIKLLIGGRDG